MKEYWDNRRVLVTGGVGFLGKHVVKRLKNAGAIVYSTIHSKEDLTDPDAVDGVMLKFRPTTVIHLAAYVGGIGANMAEPARMFYDNAMMGLNMLQKSYDHGVEKLVMVGTVCSYPLNASIPMREEEIWNGYPEKTNAAYGIAKRMLLAGCQAYRKQYGMDAVYLLPTNLYGPGDDFDPKTSHAIPAIIHKVYEAMWKGDEAVLLWGNGKSTRDFLYVDEGARAVVLAAEKYSKPEPVNIASGLETSIRDIADYIAEIMTYTGGILWDRAMPNGQPRRVMDTHRAMEQFDFADEVFMRDGLVKTIEWYKTYRG